MTRVRNPAQPWRGLPGVYYPDQTPPSFVRLARTDAPPPVRQLTVKRKLISEERAAEIVAAYQRHGTMTRVAIELRVGMSTLYKVLSAAGLKQRPPRAAKKKRKATA